MDANVAVIGVGTVGSMVLWRCTEAGLTAIGVEQFAPGHDRGAAGGESRIFRTAYREGRDYVPLLLRAERLWRQLERESGESLLLMNGGLTIGLPDTDALRRVFESIRAFDLEHELLDADAMSARYPQHRMLPGEIAVLDKQAGLLRPESAVLAAARVAAEKGAKLITRTAVTQIEPTREHVRITTDGRTFTVDTVVLSTGPWLRDLAPELAPHVTARKLVLTWYPTFDASSFSPERFPVFIRDSHGQQIYGVPTLDGRSVKVSPHTTFGDVIDHRLVRDVDVDDIDRVNEAVDKSVRGLRAYPVRVSSYMDAYSDDGHGIVGLLPGRHGRVWVAGAFSGHGFKMAPAIGDAVVQMLTGTTAAASLGRWRPERFSV